MKWLWTIAALSGFSQMAVADDTGDVRRAVERALPFIEKEGLWWIEEKACVSCHHTTFFVWAKDLAQEAGFLIDKPTLDEQRKWVWESFLAPYEPDPDSENDEAKTGEINAHRNVEGVSQLLISTSGKFVSDETRAALKKAILTKQESDGNWKPGGQLPLQQRPKPETARISNQWAALALGDSLASAKSIPEDPLSVSPAKSNEWYAMNAVLNSDAASLQALLARQNDDGGWSWIDGEPSSPTGTGQALFALARTGAAKDHPDAVVKARAYLIRTQTEDGRWDTFSTKKRAKSTRISDFWGTAWAVIGLLEVEKAIP